MLRGKSLCLTNMIFIFSCLQNLFIYKWYSLKQTVLYYIICFTGGAFVVPPCWELTVEKFPGKQCPFWDPFPGNGHSGDTHSSWPHATLRWVLIIPSPFWNKQINTLQSQHLNLPFVTHPARGIFQITQSTPRKKFLVRQSSLFRPWEGQAIFLA